tara:strand:- start:2907 stop:4241 length:1335 start_codon:yes stop_codon:yes gene_type:complete
MSYRNPKQIVDTQSGQYVRELQKSLADTSSKYFTSAKQEFERRAKLNAEIVADSQKRVNKASNEINQVANANKTINFDQMYDNLDTYNEYMQINPAKRTREMNLFISNMDNSGTNLKNNLANTVAAGEDFVEAREKGLGVPGGVYSAAEGLEKYEVMYGYNQAPGSKKMDYNPLTNEFRVNVIGANGEKLGSSLNQDIEHLDTPQIIPDETKDMKALHESVKARMDLKNPNSPAYAKQSYQTPTTVNNVNYLSKLPSEDVYLELSENLAKAEVDKMTAGEAIAFFNDVIGNGDFIKYQKTWVDGSKESVAAKEKITKAYAKYVADKFGKDVLMQAGPRIKETVQEPDKYESDKDLITLSKNIGTEVPVKNVNYKIVGNKDDKSTLYIQAERKAKVSKNGTIDIPSLDYDIDNQIPLYNYNEKTKKYSLNYGAFRTLTGSTGRKQ